MDFATTPSMQTIEFDLVAAVFADLTLLVSNDVILRNETTLLTRRQIQEASLSFYSYLILTRVLERRSQIVFMVLFWSLICII